MIGRKLFPKGDEAASIGARLETGDAGKMPTLLFEPPTRRCAGRSRTERGTSLRTESRSFFPSERASGRHVGAGEFRFRE